MVRHERARESSIVSGIAAVANGSVCRCSMARGRTLPDRTKLSRDHLCLPFRVERDPEDCFALIAQELQNRQRSLRSFIACSQVLNDNVGNGLTLRTFATHGRLPFDWRDDDIKPECVQSMAARRL